MFKDFKPEIPPDRARLARGGKLFLLVALIAVVISVGGILLLKTLQPVPVEQQAFTTQKECEEKTNKKCFLSQGLCQVMVAQNAAEAEENAKFLRDCEKKVGTWQPTEEALETDVSTPTPSPSTPLGINSVEGWQTYRNEEFGFEVKYPSELEVTQTSLGRTIFMRKNEPPFDTLPSFYFQIINLAVAGVEKNTQKLSLDGWMNYFAAGTYQPGVPHVRGVPRKISLGDREGYRVDDGREPSFVHDIYVMDDERTPFKLSLSGTGETESSVLDQILSTFRFVESKQIVSWEKALEILRSGEVTIISQTHSLDVSLGLKDGTSIHTREPRIDLIFEEIEKCGKPCENIIVATE